MKKNKFITPFLLAFCFLVACEDEHFSDIPNIAFTKKVYLDDPDYADFGIGTSIAIENVAYAGLLLYHAAGDAYKAFDLCCPIHHQDKEPLELDGALAFCPADSVQFSLLDDPAVAVDKNGATVILKSYSTHLNGKVLTVYNN